MSDITAHLMRASDEEELWPGTFTIGAVPREGEVIHFWEDRVGERQAEQRVDYMVVRVVHDCQIIIPPNGGPQSQAYSVDLYVEEISREEL